MAGHGTKKLEAKCYCGSVHFTIELALSQLPLPVHLCHCSLCRYRSGAPCILHTPIAPDVPREFIEPSVKENMSTYYFDGAPSGWQFCSTCGCHIASLANDGTWVVASSIFLDHSPDKFYIKKHIYSKSAKDGGIACMLPQVGGRQLEDQNPPEDREDAKLVEGETAFDSNRAERLRAKCHCGGVSFTISRPTEEHANDEFHSKYVSPVDKTKWLATLDICNDCRLVDGTHVIGWTFFPLAICDPPIKGDLKIGTAKTYSSSPGVLRSFCGTCGATVFFTCEDRTLSEETRVVDLATGILRAAEGPMAEKWLTWRTRVAFLESGKQYDAEFGEALEEGMRRWTAEHQGTELNDPVS